MSTMKNKDFFNRLREQSFGYEDTPRLNKTVDRRRTQKNWTKFYQENADDYDDLEEFHD